MKHIADQEIGESVQIYCNLYFTINMVAQQQQKIQYEIIIT